MPKTGARVKSMVSACTESRSIIQMPCGHEMVVRTGAKDMFIRMHKKGCKKCPADAKPMVMDAFTAGERLSGISTGTVPTVNDPRLRELARNKVMALDPKVLDEDIDAAFASLDDPEVKPGAAIAVDGSAGCRNFGLH